MIDRRKRTIILIEDDYPDYNYEESVFISTTLEGAGYTVRKMKIAELLKPQLTSVYHLHAFLMIVPNCRNLPIEALPVIRDFSESAGTVLFIGGPLFYNLVEHDGTGYVNRSLSNLLDATFTTDVKYIRDGICPSYKTYDTKKVTRLKPAENQDIFRGELILPEPINVSIPCETGVEGGFERGANARFIRVVDCMCSEEITDPVKRGRQNGRRGAFAFIELSRTVGTGYEAKASYGTVETAMIGSAAGMIGARCPIHKICGMDKLLVSMVNRMNCGIYLMEGGADGIRYYEEEDFRIGAEILNTTDRYCRVECVVTAETSKEPLVLRKSVLVEPFYTAKIDTTFDNTVVLDKIEFGKEYSICTQLFLDGIKIDELSTVYSYEKPEPVHDETCYIRPDNNRFTLNGKPWYMAGINYWPTHHQAKEKREYWLGYFDKSNYNPQNIEDDLAYIEEIGLNAVLIRVDFTGLDRIRHGVRDFLLRCRRHNIRVGICFGKATNSRFYCSEAVDEIFSQIFLANNPTVMLFDLEWETGGDLHGNSSTRSEFHDEWQTWLEKEYGSIKNAEAELNVRLRRDVYGYVEIPDRDQRTLESAQAHRKFAHENDTAAWEKLCRHLRPKIPFQMASARIARATTIHRFNQHYDIAMPETYGLGFIHYDTDPEDYQKHIGFCVCSEQLFQEESGGRPVVWAEYGASACGLGWLGYEPFVYDHDNQEYLEEKRNRQTIFNRMMLQAIEESNCAGSAPWCWNGNLRYTEMSDIGYMYTDGVLNASGAEYVEFCRRMKEKVLLPAPDDQRPVYVVFGDPYDYLGSKDEFIKKVCLPAYLEAKEKGMRLEIRIHHVNDRRKVPGDGTVLNEEVSAIIKKWYQKLDFPKTYDAEFYHALDEIRISDATSIEKYDLSSTDGKRNLLSMLFMCESLAEKYRERGIGEAVLLATLSDLVIWTNTWSEIKGELYLGELDWLKHHLGMRLFRLGRLQFCMGQAERDIPGRGVKAGDNVLEIHIPEGEPLSKEACLQSIEAARKFFEAYFPEFDYKCFTCHSWLLDASLEKFMKPESNILQFGRMFDAVHMEKSDAILRYVFRWDTTRENLEFAAPYNHFTEAVKRHVMQGGACYEVLGVLR